jgi:hypothetical protein
VVKKQSGIKGLFSHFERRFRWPGLHLDPAEGSSDSTNNPHIKISVGKTNFIQTYVHPPAPGDPLNAHTKYGYARLPTSLKLVRQG